MTDNSHSTEKVSQPASDGVLIFGPYTLDLQRAVLMRDGIELPLRPKCFDVLRYLAEHNGRLVTKDEILASVWPGLVVSDSSLAQCVVEIRRALGADGKSIVRTVPRRGYRFEGPMSLDLFASPRAAMRPPGNKTIKRGWLAGALAALVAAVFGLSVHGRLSAPDGAPDHDSVARELYLQGMYFQDRRSSGDLKRSVTYFRRATELDPGLADAWVGLAASIALEARYRGETGFHSWGREFKAALDRALQLEPEHPEAHARIAGFYAASGEHDTAEAHFQKAVRNGGNNAAVLAMAAGRAYRQRDLQQAVELQSRSVELNPLSSAGQSNLGIYLFSAGNFILARERLEIARDLNPDRADEINVTLVQAMVLAGDFVAASKLAKDLAQGPDRDQAMAFVYHARGDKAHRDRHLDNLVADASELSALRLAEFHGYLGERDRSRRWLGVLLQLKSGEISGKCYKDFVNELRVSPFLANLVDDPVLAKAEKRLGA